MSADNISRISRKLLGSCLAEDGSAHLHSTNYREDIALLPSPLREIVLEFADETRTQIPTDFSFGLTFDYEGVRVSLEFEDGNTGSFGRNAYFTSRKSMRRYLRREPWDELRLSGIKDGDIFDELLSEAEDRPVNIPSSEEAAKKYAAAIASVVADVRAAQPLPPFALLIGDDGNVGAEELITKESVIHTIADRMTVQCDILGVLERGVSWSFAELEAAKLVAVEGLGPISRAKAERRFGI